MPVLRGRNDGSRLFIIGVFTAIFALIFVLSSNRIIIADRKLLQQGEKPLKNPTVYTFADPAAYSYVNDKLLQIWGTSWASAGYTTRILNLEDAKQHPKYDQYSQRLKAANIDNWHEQSLLPFIAMSTAEDGGFFAEHIVLPLKNIQKDLPNKGMFTMHNGVHADLMSGNKDEWNRITQVLMDNIIDRDIVRTLLKIHQTGSKHFFLQESVISTSFPEDLKQFSLDCNEVRDKIAVRFRSERMVKDDLIPDDYVEFVQMFKERYNDQCHIEVSRTLSENRPKIHTFFDDLETLAVEENYRLLDMWRTFWYEAGWDPVVLTMTDAERHPDFDEFNATLHNGTFQSNVYNRLCYFRWLAMAASGGGWMTDIDTFPLNIKVDKALPNNGNFTGFSGYVPCLVSGSALEWNRMAMLMMDSYRKNGHNFWSDMYAMRQLWKQGEFQTSNRGKIATIRGLYPDTASENENALTEYFTEEMCEKTELNLVNHFSHHDIALIAGKRKRTEVITHWMSLWERICKHG